jgi:hypothetical protein
MKAAPQGPIAVDPEDAHLMKRRWCRHNKGYARRWMLMDGRVQLVFLHREITKAPKGMQVDHVNGDVLDNRRCNLRVCTAAQNNSNRRCTSKHGYLGLSRKKEGFYYGVVKVNGCQVRTKAFRTAAEAARARDVLAAEAYGPFARLNFPQERAA